MKPLLLSTFDISGGAARAAYRLHQGLIGSGADSRMLVRSKFSQDVSVIGADKPALHALNRLHPKLDGLPKTLLKGLDRKKRTPYSVQWIPDFLLDQVNQFDPDIINVHWVGGGFLNIETISKFKRPVVWTLHDMWAFTGGCHYSQGCDRYQRFCQACPQMPPRYNLDLSHWIWKRKAQSWANLTATVVTPSQWLANCARASSLFKNHRIEVIPYGLDTEVFRPIEQSLARYKLNLPQDKRLILFGASDGTNNLRKGFSFLKVALEILSQNDLKNQFELVIFGASKSNQSIDLGIKAHYLGNLSDEITLTCAYSAADVFVAPSLEDNLPNTVLESLACGTPCVAFTIGGMPDLIDHYRNGYLANAIDSSDLARGIAWVLERQAISPQVLREAARAKAEQSFRLETQSACYLALFEELKNQNLAVTC